MYTNEGEVTDNVSMGNTVGYAVMYSHRLTIRGTRSVTPETIRQTAQDGTPLVKVIEQAGSIPGIKVDKGAKPLAFCPGETITEGLDGLRERLVEYRDLGAKFCKWRAVIDIGPGIPSYDCISANAHALARYAALCQEENLVPIVEPEVLMDGDHDLDRCEQVTEFVLKMVFGSSRKVWCSSRIWWCPARRAPSKYPTRRSRKRLCAC